MLSRARDKAKAKVPSAAASSANGKPDLAKQLFPSSSPSTQDGNITHWATSHKGRATSTSSSSILNAHEPLRPRSNNLQPPSYKAAFSTESNANYPTLANNLASICSNADSFQDEVEVEVGQNQSQGRTVASVYIAEEDFSDDNTLELDYECPASLPSVPLSAPQKAPAAPAPSPLRPNTQLPWSSSPQEHMFPPAALRDKSLKRDSPDGNPPPGPVAKKRSLPPTFRVDKSEVQGVASAQDKPSTAPEIKKPALWDATHSATAERRKQIKSQSKKSDLESQHSTDRVQPATDQHAIPKPVASAISLSSEQQQVIDLVIRKKQSVFFTGPAGTGKSVLMRAIIAELKKKWARDPERLSVTASTGLAACNIGGQTLHSFAGIGLGKEDVPSLVKKIRRNPKAKNRWLRTSVLVVDEVSMVDGDLFDKLAQIARTIRNNGRPWGGIQLVITGDFFQLPPVPDGGKREAKFAFDAATWNTSIDHTIGLTQIFRQRDPHFADMLNEMRLGRISDNTVETFKGLARTLESKDGLEVTELFPTRYEVERSNESRLRNLPGEAYHYDANDTGDPHVRDKLLANMMAPKAISLKKGAQVMLIKNMDDTLVNGSLGKVIGFMNEATFEVWNSADEVGSSDEAELDARSKKIKAYSRAPENVKNLKDLKQYPIVRFTATDGTHRILLCIPEEWKVELPTGEVQAARKQLPLILAWALSIHKAQGQTLERVKVDLGKVFEKGQAYVALSRAVSKQGLQVLRFDKNRVMAHPRVVQFYNKLYSAEAAVKTKKVPDNSEFAFRGASSLSNRKDVNAIDVDEEEAAMAVA